MEPLTVKTFDPVLVEAIESEQKKAGDITYTSVKFSYNEGKDPPIRIMENLNYLISKAIILCPYSATKKKLSSLKN